VAVSDFAGRSVFVTGGTGFIGSWLVARLLDLGARVTVLVLDHDPSSELIRSGRIRSCRVVDGRLEEIGDVERALLTSEAEIVFHLGAQALVIPALEAPLLTLEANVRGTYNLLEACRRHPNGLSAVVAASSDKAYGDAPVLPYTEEMPVAGRHPYDVSKSCADLLARAYAHTYALPVTVARCGNVYGGGDLAWSRIVPGTIRSVLGGERPILRSDGRYTRDYIHVDDIVDAYLALAGATGGAARPGDVFNFAPGAPASVREIVDLLLVILGREDLAPVVLDTARAEIRDQALDAGKARRLLEWEPRTGLREGLERTVAWYRAFLGAA
jgi:CDP-glucose 4,6-dehydratase